MEKATVYITGASGFIGKNLLVKVVADSRYDVVTIGRHWGDLTFDEFLSTDLRANSVVVHLAGKAHDLAGGDPDEYRAVNTVLTERVYSHFVESKATVFIFMSSVKAVADHATSPLDEEREPRPTTPYGRSKLLAEQFIRSRPAGPSKRVYILRPSVVYGPGNKGNLALLLGLVQRGIPYPLGSFRNSRSFLNLNNLLAVIARLCEGDVPSGTYNVADDEPLSSADVVTLLAVSMRRRPRLLKITPVVVRAMAKLGDVLRLPFNSERLDKVVEDYVVVNDKLLAALEWESMPIGAREGLGELGRQYQRT